MLLHILTAVFSIGTYHPDEHFQIIEFAQYKLGFNTPSGLPWEFHSQLRPALAPFLVYLCIKGSHALGLQNPFIIASFLRMLVGLLSWGLSMWVTWVGFGWLRSDAAKKVLILLSCFLWFIPFIHVRVSSENLAGLCFVLGWLLMIQPQERASLTFKSPLLSSTSSGVFLALSFLFRFQMGLAIAGLLLWSLLFSDQRKWQPFLTGAVIVLGIALHSILDFWLYDRWVFTAWNYFYTLLVEGAHAQFGPQPWWYFFGNIFLRAGPPFSLLIWIAAGAFIWKYPKHSVTWATVPFLVIHMLIGHKEGRFLFPWIHLLPVIVVMGLEDIPWSFKHQAKKFWTTPLPKVFLSLFWILNLLLLSIICFFPAHEHAFLYQFLYYRPHTDNVTLLAYKNGLYHHNSYVHMSFYKPPWMTEQIETDPQRVITQVTHASTPILLAIEKFGFPEELEPIRHRCQRIYSNLPQWLEPFNINNWQSRAFLWAFFECQNRD